MANIVDAITDYSPPNDGINVPLQSDVVVTFDRLMDEERLEEDFFLEGPDTDQYIGPGLLELSSGNVSQGDPDDFFMSPGYKGIVPGSYSFESPDGTHTVLTFSPDKPLAPDLDYTAYINETLDATGATLEGIVTWSFQTGTGSIEVLPSAVSTSVIAIAPQAIAELVATSPLEIVSTVPADHSVENAVGTKEFILEFNKEVDAASAVDSNFIVSTYVVSDHPALNTTTVENLAKVLSVDGNKVTIAI